MCEDPRPGRTGPVRRQEADLAPHGSAQGRSEALSTLQGIAPHNLGASIGSGGRGGRDASTGRSSLVYTSSGSDQDMQSTPPLWCKEGVEVTAQHWGPERSHEHQQGANGTSSPAWHWRAVRAIPCSRSGSVRASSSGRACERPRKCVLGLSVGASARVRPEACGEEQTPLRGCGHPVLSSGRASRMQAAAQARKCRT
jgi:hypothetical protein